MRISQGIGNKLYFSSGKKQITPIVYRFSNMPRTTAHGKNTTVKGLFHSLLTIGLVAYQLSLRKQGDLKSGYPSIETAHLLESLVF